MRRRPPEDKRPGGLRRREEYLASEAQRLAPYASKAAETRGRAHPETEHPLRSPYERDRDRIIHSGAFRKLEYKTQVFVNHEGDYYRTRLTHTLEVAQIARSAARFLHLNEDLTEAIALVHDVGHPPFGHAGEQALHDCMAEHVGFEHNLHALRVVDELEEQYAEFPGLNLTWEVREAIVKHSKAFDTSDPPSGLAEFATAPWPCLEAQLVDACDEIAYNAHDIDDGLAAGMIRIQELNRLELWRQMVAGCRGQGADLLRYQGVRSLINAQVVDLVETVERRVQEQTIGSADEVRAARAPLVSLSEGMAVLNAELRQFLMEHVYRHYRVARMGIKARRIVADLFDAFAAEPALMPDEYRRRRAAATVTGTNLSAGSADVEPDNASTIARLVCDYLAGLSDREALREHSRLFDPVVAP